MGEKRLVYDVGLHMGEDSSFYLSQGYRVIAFEANPDLIAYCSNRFQKQICAGEITIVEGAIVDPGVGETISFYRNRRKSVWGTTRRDWKDRNELLSSDSIEITVQAIKFNDCLAAYGTPYFAKIDIEGADRLVLRALCKLASPPMFVSVESEKVDFNQLVTDFDLLDGAGYRRFKIVQQATIPGSMLRGYRFENHASGPFGEDLPGPWLDRGEAIDRYRKIFKAYEWIGDRSLVGRFGRSITKPLEKLLKIGLPGWHDLHAAR